MRKTARPLAIGIATLILGSAAVLAQTPDAPSPSNQPATQTGHQRPVPTAQRAKQGDREFMKEAAAGSLFEMQASQLALEKSSNTDVDAFARLMLEDHHKMSKAMEAQANKFGEQPKPVLSTVHAAAMEEMRGQTGTSFDRSYATAMVVAHEEDVSLFRQEANSGAAADLRRLAELNVPTLEHHLELAQQLQTSVGGQASR